MPTREIEFKVTEFNQWPLKREPPSKFSVVYASIEKAKSSSSQGAGRPQNEGGTQLKVTIFLGCDKEARELKNLKS